jgi:hypothetical protein
LEYDYQGGDWWLKTKTAYSSYCKQGSKNSRASGSNGHKWPPSRHHFKSSKNRRALLLRHSRCAQKLVVESRSESYGKTNKQNEKERRETAAVHYKITNQKKKAKRHFFNSIIIIPRLLNPSPTPLPPLLS